MTDWTALRSQIPALSRVTYLNTATVAPAAAPVLAAVRRAQEEWESGEFSWQGWERQADATRELFAAMIGGRAAEVGLLTTVAEAAATVAASLPKGRVVVGEREFRSNFLPWAALRRRGFEVVEVPATHGVVSTAALLQAITPGTTLVAVSETQSSNGYRVRVAELGARCRQVDARLFVNLTQTLGALRFDVNAAGADYVSAHGYKWLLAPRGVTWLWARPDRLPELEPLAPSWKTVAEPYADYYGAPDTLATDGRKLDTPLAWFPWVGARPALELLRSLDAAEVEKRCLALGEVFRKEAAARGFSLSPLEAPSQTVGVRVPDPVAVKQRLAARKVIAAVRDEWLRLSFHAYNDESDLAAALDAMGRA